MIQKNISVGSIFAMMRNNWKKLLFFGISIKLIIAIIIIIMINSNIANAFSVTAFGYKVSYNDNPKVTDEVGNMQNIQFTNEFSEEIKFINSFKESQMFLKELDYGRIGVIDISTNIGYTDIITQEGIISHLERGINEPEAIIRVNIPKVAKSIENNNFAELKNLIHIPFKLKLKILLMRWF